MASVRTSGAAIGDRVRRRLPAALGLGVGVLALAGCAQADRPQSTMDPKGEYAQKIFNLSWPVFMIAGIVGVIVFVTIIVAIVRFRERPGHMATPKQVHGNPALEIGLTVLPAILLAAIAVPTIKVLFELNAAPKDPLVVNVIGQQWWWEFDYPSIKGGDNLPLVTANEMVIPAGRQVKLSITSRDVIHSFWIPKLNGKRDAVPGRVQNWNLQAEHPGDYWGQCTEFCGLSHANMRMRVIALTPDDFDRWVALQQTNAAAASTDAAKAGEAQFKSLCASCHQVNGLKDAEGQQIVSQPQTQVVQRGRAQPDPPDEPQHVRRLQLRPAEPGLPGGAGQAERERPGGLRRGLPQGHHARVPQPAPARGLAAQPARDDPDVRRPDQAGGHGRQVPRHAEPEPDRGPDRPAGRLPQDPEPQPDLAGGRTRWRSSNSQPNPWRSRGPRKVTPTRPTASSAVRSRRRGGGRGCSRSTTRRSASCTAVTAFFFFVVGGIEALLIRLQLARPNGKLLTASTYNQMFTMHATTMIFLFVMPMAAAFANYLVPLQIGARDVAFPRLNAFGFWCFLFGGIFLNISWFLGGAPDGGWFIYPPNAGVAFSPSHGVDFWVARPADHRHRLAHRRHQPDRHHPQHARARA